MHDPARVYPVGAKRSARARAVGDRRRPWSPAFSRARAVVVLLVAATAGCASAGERSGGSPPAGEAEAPGDGPESMLHVSNRNWLDMKIYGIRNAERFTLMSITSMRSDSVPLPASLLAGSGFVLETDPVGAIRPYKTSRIYMRPGQSVWLKIENVLDQSSIWVH